MHSAALVALASAASYLLGSIPWGYFVARSRGVDIQRAGSGNIGATNVARTVGKRLGLLVLILDALKGAIPLLVLRYADLGIESPYGVTVVGVAAVLGHCFPVWLRFRGGKGVATALGIFAVLAPFAMAIGVGMFIALFAVTRIASVGSLAAAGAVPLLMWSFASPWPDVLCALIVAAIIAGKHRENIRRLQRGKELTV